MPGDATTNPLKLRPYQVFSKINNYTGKRLAGYKVVVGIGTGSAFQSASEAGIADKLHISLGVGEGYSDGASACRPTDRIFWKTMAVWLPSRMASLVR